MLRNKKYKNKRAEERMNFVENAKKNRCDNNDMSELYSSFGDNMVFDTKMINSIKNNPDLTDIISNLSSHGLNIVSGV
jgi:hypothetical protein